MRERAGVFDVSHMGEVETAGPEARGAPAAPALQRRRRKIAERRRAVLRAVPRGRRRARRPLHLPARRRPLPDRHQRRQPRARPRLVPRATRGGFDVDGRRPARRLRDARRPGPARPAALVAGARRRRAAAALHARAELHRRRRARRARLRHRLHGRGRRRAAGRRPTARGAVWDARRGRRRRRPSGSARATRCAWRPASTSTATTCPRTATRSRPASAGAARRTRASSAPSRSRAAREHGTAEKLVPFAITGPGIARQGNPVVGGGVVTSGTLSPMLGYGIGMAYLPAERTEPGTPFEIDVRGKTAHAPKSAPSPSSRKER